MVFFLLWMLGCFSDGSGDEGRATGPNPTVTDTGTNTPSGTSTGVTTVGSTGDTGLQTMVWDGVWVFDSSQATVDGTLGLLVDLSDLGSLVAQRVTPVSGTASTPPATSPSLEVYRLGQDLLDSPLTQDTCVSTVDVDVEVTGSQFLAFAPSLSIVWEIPLEMYGVSIEGEVSPSGTSLENVTVRALLDSRGLISLVGGTASGDMCDLLVAFGVSCVPCGGGLPDVCYPYSAQGFVA